MTTRRTWDRALTVVTGAEFSRDWHGDTKRPRADWLSPVITEQVRDPRWIALAHGIPRIQVVHDERRDDGVEQRPAFACALFDRWGSRSAATVTYSNYAAIAVRREVAGRAAA